MSGTRNIIKFLAFAAPASFVWYGGTKISYPQKISGVITEVRENDDIIGTNELTLKRSEVAGGYSDGNMEMSLQSDSYMLHKAKKYAQKNEFVEVTYNRHWLRNPFLAKTHREVKSIEPIDATKEYKSPNNKW